MKRKLLLLTILFAGLVQISFAQLLDDSTQVKFFFFGGAEYMPSNKYDNLSFLEIAGGLNIQGVEIIGKGRSMISKTNYSNDTIPSSQINITYGSIGVGYIFMDEKKISPFLQGGFSIGNISLSKEETYSGNTYISTIKSDEISELYLEGGIDISINWWLEVRIGARYNTVYGLELLDLQAKDFSGISGWGGLKFNF